MDNCECQRVIDYNKKLISAAPMRFDRFFFSLYDQNRTGTESPPYYLFNKYITISGILLFFFWLKRGNITYEKINKHIVDQRVLFFFIF